MYQIKAKTGDFRVMEQHGALSGKEGQFLYAILRKEGWNTITAVAAIARKLGIKLKRIGYAGNKDKQAFTEQLISLQDIAENQLTKVKVNGIALEPIGRGNKPVSIGSHKGNRFEIVVRNLKKGEIATAQRRATLLCIPNYFGEQRFSKQNAAIGKALVKNSFKEAARFIDQQKVMQYLAQHPADYVGALRKLPTKLLKLFVHSYQSLLWNKMASEICKKVKRGFREIASGKLAFPEERIEQQEVPLIGYATLPFIGEKVLREEGITARDFLIRALPELSSEGGTRKLLMEIKDFSMSEPEEDKLNKRKWKVTLKFFLPKGSYATVVVDGLFG